MILRCSFYFNSAGTKYHICSLSIISLFGKRALHIMPWRWLGRANLVCRDKVRMEPSETADKPEANKTICHDCQWSWRFFNGLHQWMVTPTHEKLDVQSTHCTYIDTQDCRRQNKTEEVPVISLSNTLPNPRAVMIKALNTVITFGAVGAARRPVYHASFTVFHFHRHTIDHNLFYSRKLKSMWSWSIMRKLFHRWVWIPWYNTWILRWGKQEQ